MSGHVLNSKLVSEPCKQFCFGCRVDPEHDQNFIKHNFRHFFKTLHQGSYTHIAHTSTRESAVHTSMHTAFRENTQNYHTISVLNIQKHKGLANS